MTNPISAEGKDGLVTFDGVAVRINRPHHLREFFKGLLISCFRSARVTVPIERIEQVLPRLRPIWDEQGWENHWWPRGQGKGARGTAGAVAGAAAGEKA